MASELDEDILLKVVCEVWAEAWNLQPVGYLPIYVYETRDELKRVIELYLKYTKSRIVTEGT